MNNNPPPPTPLARLHPHILRERGCNFGAAGITVDGLELVLHDFGIGLHLRKGAFPAHVHAFDELVCTLSGEGEVLFNNHIHPAAPGHVFFLPAGTEHEMRWNSPKQHPWRLMVLHLDFHFDPDLLDNPGAHILRMELFPFFDWFIRQDRRELTLSPAELAEITAWTDPEAGRIPPSPHAFMACTSIFLMLLGLLSKSIQHQNTAVGHFATASPEDRHAYHLHKAKQLIESRGGHLSVSIEEVAASIGLSLSHFNRQFIEFYGISPHHYAFEVTMKRAGSLLPSAMSIKEIGLTVGYTAASSFTRAFTEYYGCSPQAYRQRTRRHNA